VIDCITSSYLAFRYEKAHSRGLGMGFFAAPLMGKISKLFRVVQLARNSILYSEKAEGVAV